MVTFFRLGPHKSTQCRGAGDPCVEFIHVVLVRPFCRAAQLTGKKCIQKPNVMQLFLRRLKVRVFRIVDS